MVQSGVSLVNSYRMKYQTCQRGCYKYFYTSSVFVPEKGMDYDIILEPIDGVDVYKIDNGMKIKQEGSAKISESCRY
jgi:hypothetical protein